MVVASAGQQLSDLRKMGNKGGRIFRRHQRHHFLGGEAVNRLNSH
jgi:hypothetical protein